MIRKKRNPIGRYLSHPYMLSLLGLLLIIFMSWPLLRNLQKQKAIRGEMRSLENEIADLESRNTELKGLIDYFRSDEFVEEQARLSLNYRHPGEEVLVIKDEDADAVKPDASSYNIPGKAAQKAVAEEKNPSKWFRYFFE